MTGHPVLYALEGPPRSPSGARAARLRAPDRPRFRGGGTAPNNTVSQSDYPFRQPKSGQPLVETAALRRDPPAHGERHEEPEPGREQGGGWMSGRASPPLTTTDPRETALCRQSRRPAPARAPFSSICSGVRGKAAPVSRHAAVNREPLRRWPLRARKPSQTLPIRCREQAWYRAPGNHSPFRLVTEIRRVMGASPKIQVRVLKP